MSGTKIRERMVEDYYLTVGDFAFDYMSIDFNLYFKVVYLPDTSLYSLHDGDINGNYLVLCETTMPRELIDRYTPILRECSQLLRTADEYGAIPRWITWAY